MRPIADNCYQLEGSRGANGYLLHGGGHTAVVDPGMNSGYAAVLAELGRAEPAVGRVTDILLTHYDADHSQVVKRLQRTLNTRVWLGAADAAILRGDAQPPTRLRRVLKRLAPVSAPDDVIELDGRQALFAGLTAFPTPGHTPGHVAYQWGPVLFSGDSVVVRKNGDIGRFYGPLNSDNVVAEKTTELLRSRIAGGSIQWICPGHNPPRRVRR